MRPERRWTAAWSRLIACRFSSKFPWLIEFWIIGPRVYTVPEKVCVDCGYLMNSTALSTPAALTWLYCFRPACISAAPPDWRPIRLPVIFAATYYECVKYPWPCNLLKCRYFLFEWIIVLCCSTLNIWASSNRGLVWFRSGLWNKPKWITSTAGWATTTTPKSRYNSSYWVDVKKNSSVEFPWPSNNRKLKIGSCGLRCNEVAKCCRFQFEITHFQQCMVTLGR